MSMTDPKVIFQDNQILILDKPSGWIVNDATTVKDQPVIQRWLFENFNYPISKDRGLRSGVVHRIDKETSGLLIIAKTKDAFEKIQSEFKERKVEKSYLALVHGQLFPKTGNINVSVGRLPWRRDRFGILASGRNSETNYEVLEYYTNKNEKFSLVGCFPKTGRTHQIRIHMKHLNHPIVGDSFYAGRKTSRNDRLWCSRLFLHAEKVSFIHPSSKKIVSFESELPKELKEVLGSLRIFKEED